MYTIKEKAARLGISVQVTYRKIRKDEIPHILYGRLVRCFENDPPRTIQKTLIIESPPSFNLKDFDRKYLKKEVKMSKSKSRWSYGFGGVFILDNGKWYYWLNTDGKRTITSTKGAQNRTEAVAVLMKARNVEFKKKYSKGAETEEITFRDFCDEFESLNGNENDKYTICQLKNSPYFKDKKLHEIMSRDVEDYVNEKFENGVSRGTTNRHAGMIQKIINKAERRGYRVPKIKVVIHREHIKKVDSRDMV